MGLLSEARKKMPSRGIGMVWAPSSQPAVSTKRGLPARWIMRMVPGNWSSAMRERA